MSSRTATLAHLRRMLMRDLSLPRSSPQYDREYKALDRQLSRIPEPNLARIERELQDLLVEVRAQVTALATT